MTFSQCRRHDWLMVGYFPSQSYGSNNLAYFPEGYANIVLNDLSDRNWNLAIVANFKSNLNLESIMDDNFGKLTMRVSYDSTTGYGKDWVVSSPETTIDAMFIPRK